MAHYNALKMRGTPQLAERVELLSEKLAEAVCRTLARAVRVPERWTKMWVAVDAEESETKKGGRESEVKQRRWKCSPCADKEAQAGEGGPLRSSPTKAVNFASEMR